VLLERVCREAMPLWHAGPGLLLVHGRTNRSTPWDGAAVTGAGECGVVVVSWATKESITLYLFCESK
jgi:hypothetical protein